MALPLLRRPEKIPPEEIFGNQPVPQITSSLLAEIQALKVPWEAKALQSEPSGVGEDVVMGSPGVVPAASDTSLNASRVTGARGSEFEEDLIEIFAQEDLEEESESPQ